MSKRIIETVSFQLADGVSKQDFLNAIDCSTQFVKTRPGFICRRLSCAEDGTWIEHIEWASLEEAQQAAAAIGQTESVQPFLRCIDGASAELRHSELELAIN